MIRGVIFDKDGTLFDFHATWGRATAEVLVTLADGDGTLARRLGRAIGYDAETGRFRAGSPSITGPMEAIEAALAPELPDHPPGRIAERLAEASAGVEQVPAAPLAEVMAALAARGLALAVVTNDGAAGARAAMRAEGIETHFAAIIGADSGHGAKPAAEPLLAAARAMGTAPGATLMVGDTRHDLDAAAAAGMPAVGVLTGAAGHDELAGGARAVLPDIGHLPEWLGQF